MQNHGRRKKTITDQLMDRRDFPRIIYYRSTQGTEENPVEMLKAPRRFGPRTAQAKSFYAVMLVPIRKLGGIIINRNKNK